MIWSCGSSNRVGSLLRAVLALGILRLGLSAVLGLIGLVLLLTLDVRGYIEDDATARLSGLSVDENLGIAWIMVVFWGFVWAWLLIALHKRPLRRLVERLVREVDAQVTSH